jgi:DNA-binding transcriptional MerR regulator
MASHHPIRKTVKPAGPALAPEIPDRLYFRIGDVAKLCAVPAYVLRFWETEFPQLKPNKGGTGQRLYRRKDVDTALRIKSLLYDQGYTIPGARQAMRAEAAKSEPSANAVILSGASQLDREAESKDPNNAGTAAPGNHLSTATPALHALREELRALCAQLNQPVAEVPAPAVSKPVRQRPTAPAKTPDATVIHLNQQDLFPAE